MSNIEEYRISNDPNDINIINLHHFLSTEAYWCLGIPFEVVEKSVRNSLCFSVINPDGQFVGFARVITDYATFAYLADVYIDKKERGKNLGRLLVSEVMKHPDVQGLRTWTLFTKDSHGLYEPFGWSKADDPSRLMVVRNKSIYL